MRVTRTNLPSGETSIARNIAGWPIAWRPATGAPLTGFVFAPFAGACVSTRASCPVACHSRSCNSYGVDMRLGNVRSRFRSLPSWIFTSGPVGATGGAGIAGRFSGTSTVAICFPSWVKSNVVTSVASTGRGVIWRGVLVATSVIQMCVASSVWTKYATALPSGDQAAFDTRAFGGVASVFLVPSAADTIWRPTPLLTVSGRARLALKSTNRPPSSWNGFEKVAITTGPSPTWLRNHFLSGLRLPSATFCCRGAVTAAASSGGGVA